MYSVHVLGSLAGVLRVVFIWIESVDPVADLHLTNQVFYGTVLSSTAEQLLNSTK